MVSVTQVLREERRDKKERQTSGALLLTNIANTVSCGLLRNFVLKE